MNPSLKVRGLGILSGVLLGLGAVGPLAKATLMTAYLSDVSKVRVGLLLVIAAAAIYFSIQGKTRRLRWTTLLAVLTLASLAGGGGDDTYVPIVSDVTKFLMDVLKSVFTDVAKAIVHLQWGAYCLVLGLVGMGGVGLGREDRVEGRIDGGVED